MDYEDLRRRFVRFITAYEAYIEASGPHHIVAGFATARRGPVVNLELSFLYTGPGDVARQRAEEEAFESWLLIGT